MAHMATLSVYLGRSCVPVHKFMQGFSPLVLSRESGNIIFV